MKGRKYRVHHGSWQVALILAASLFSAIARAAPPEISLWPGVPPGDENFTPPPPRPARAAGPNPTTRIELVTTPTLTLFRPRGAANGTAVIVCPGGGYSILAWDKEGTEVAEWLNELGITALVLKYRVPRRDPQAWYAAPLRDAQRALRLVRQRAGEWGVAPDRVGILGFSAGGNLAVMAATAWERNAYSEIDDADRLSARPDFAIPIYPAYLGDENEAGPLDPAIRVHAHTPPMFIAVTHDDRLRGMNAALLYAELKKASVPAELHIFVRGGHGYGLRPSAHAVSQWPRLCADWLRAMGLVPGITGAAP